MAEDNIILNYIAVWNWHILAILSLAASLIIITLGDNLMSTIMFVGLFVGFVVCEILSYVRRNKIIKEVE